MVAVRKLRGNRNVRGTEEGLRQTSPGSGELEQLKAKQSVGPQLRRVQLCSSVQSERERYSSERCKSVCWDSEQETGKRGWIGVGASLTQVVSAFSEGRTRSTGQLSLVACRLSQPYRADPYRPNRVSEGSPICVCTSRKFCPPSH